MKYSIAEGVINAKHTIQKLFIAALALTIPIILAASMRGAGAATTIVVTPADTQGWSTADTRPGGNVTFISDAEAPGGSALKLATENVATAKAQYLHQENTPLSSVTELSYETKQNSAPFAQGAPSYQLIVNLNGTSGFTTFVYEPYQNGTVTPGTWQTWDVDAGQMWSTRTVNTDADPCHTVAGGGGAPFYRLADLQEDCPNAVVIGFGVNIGTNNPNYDTEADLANFNSTTYDFQTAAPPVTLASKDDCKKGGWATSNNPSFKNQGDCVSFFATQGRNEASGGSSFTHFTYGSVTLSSPVQQVNFSGTDNGSGTIAYANPSAALAYTTDLTCVNVDGNTASFAYVIPSGNPFAGTWVVWKVVDNGSSDTAGFTTAPDMASANALCEAGNASVTNYAITSGDVIVQ